MQDQKVPKGYKKTEIGIIPEDWEVKKLGEIADIRTGPFGSSIKKEYFDKKGIPLYSAKNVLSKNFDLYEKIKNEKYKLLKQFTLEYNDILCTTRGTIGVFKIFPKNKKKGIIHSNLSIIRFNRNKKVIINFIEFLLNWKIIKKQIKAIQSSTTINALYGQNISNFLIPLPPLPEQRAIAKVLSDIDLLIETLDKLIEKKKLIKKGTMQLLLTSKKRLPGFTGKWVRKKLGSLFKSFTKQTGFDYSAYIKPKLIRKSTKNTLPFIQNKNFSGKKFNFNTDYYIPEEIANKFPNILLNEKCLLISISGNIGNVGIFPNTQKAFTGGAIAVAKFKDKYQSQAEWIMYYLLSEDGQNLLLNKVKAGSHKNLILADIRNIIIPLPPTVEEQRAIAQILSDMDAEIEALEKQKLKYENIKKGAMDLLLTGKVRLKNYNSK